jgi:putative 4-mercaptohistidine N1-methyltranferase
MATNFYETDRALAEYLLFHYGAQKEILPYDFGPADALNFPVRCVTECLDAPRLAPRARALDLGCAVGRSTFELARHCAQVIGIDFSRRFIDIASHLQRQGSFTYAFVEEGLLTTPAVAVVPTDIDRQSVSFEQGDADELRADLGQFDVVLMANLIDRLREPRRCLQQMAKLMKPGGQLIITSPYTWLLEYTPKKNWFGGCDREGKPIKTFGTLKELLSPLFGFSFRKDMPFLIREHARKFQWCVAEASVWVRQ